MIMSKRLVFFIRDAANKNQLHCLILGRFHKLLRYHKSDFFIFSHFPILRVAAHIFIEFVVGETKTKDSTEYFSAY